MANQDLFASATSTAPPTNTVNEAGGVAYKFPPKHALAQLAATGTFANVFYAKAEKQLNEVRMLASQVDDRFLAQLAVYAREKAFMKDMPAALLVILSLRDRDLTRRIFPRVVDSGRVLRTVFQMVRSGQFGRKGLSTSLRNQFREWLNGVPDGALLSASIGNKPSLHDILRMAKPKPANPRRDALFGWIAGKQYNRSDLPESVQMLQAFRETDRPEIQVKFIESMPQIRWDLLAGSAVDDHRVWCAIARNMGPQALRMNLNTLQRHGVLKGDMIDYVASRIADPKAITQSKQFPYQFFAAYHHMSSDIPHKIRESLHRAAEIACGNIPELPGPIVIGVDVSGSMASPVTGYGSGATTKVRCVDVAALFGAAMLRRNPDSVVLPFDTQVHAERFDPGDTILSLTEKLVRHWGGGTNCELPISHANQFLQHRRFEGVVIVSDNQSWITNQGRFGWQTGPSGTMSAWEGFRKIQRGHGVENPKLVCIDIQPYGSTQAPDRDDILNVGGFSDAVFSVVSSFMSGDSSRFVREVEEITL